MTDRTRFSEAAAIAPEAPRLAFWLMWCPRCLRRLETPVKWAEGVALGERRCGRADCLAHHRSAAGKDAPREEA